MSKLTADESSLSSYCWNCFRFFSTTNLNIFCFPLPLHYNKYKFRPKIWGHGLKKRVWYFSEILKKNMIALKLKTNHHFWWRQLFRITIYTIKVRYSCLRVCLRVSVYGYGFATLWSDRWYDKEWLSVIGYTREKYYHFCIPSSNPWFKLNRNHYNYYVIMSFRYLLDFVWNCPLLLWGSNPNPQTPTVQYQLMGTSR